MFMVLTHKQKTLVMNILKQKLIFFNQTTQQVPLQLRQLFSFGCRSLALQSVVSVRGNARAHITNYHTAKSKAWRLLKNTRWLTVFAQLLTQLGLVSVTSRIAVDFSTFGRFQILTFAVQTRLGRALPVYFEIITYPIKKDSQNIFICQAIERFVAAVNCRPKLVMDRGFACPHIVKHMADVSHPFVVRIKGIKQFRNWQNRLFKARNTRQLDQVIQGYGRRLRLVISDDPSNGNEPWYLVTNDIISVRDGIIADYYHRFEIEEFFKDAKWLQGLEHLRFQKIQSMSVVLWFVILGWWRMALLKRDTPVRTYAFFLTYDFVKLNHLKGMITWLSLLLRIVRKSYGDAGTPSP